MPVPGPLSYNLLPHIYIVSKIYIRKLRRQFFIFSVNLLIRHLGVLRIAGKSDILPRNLCAPHPINQFYYLVRLISNSHRRLCSVKILYFATNTRTGQSQSSVFWLRPLLELSPGNAPPTHLRFPPSAHSPGPSALLRPSSL